MAKNEKTLSDEMLKKLESVKNAKNATIALIKLLVECFYGLNTKISNKVILAYNVFVANGSMVWHLDNTNKENHIIVTISKGRFVLDINYIRNQANLSIMARDKKRVIIEIYADKIHTRGKFLNALNLNDAMATTLVNNTKYHDAPKYDMRYSIHNLGDEFIKAILEGIKAMDLTNDTKLFNLKDQPDRIATDKDVTAEDIANAQSEIVEEEGNGEE